MQRSNGFTSRQFCNKLYIINGDKPIKCEIACLQTVCNYFPVLSNLTKPQNQFIIKKVAIAQKIVIKNYLFRVDISHSITSQSNLNFNKLYSIKKSFISSSSCKNLVIISTLNQNTSNYSSIMLCIRKLGKRKSKIKTQLEIEQVNLEAIFVEKLLLTIYIEIHINRKTPQKQTFYRQQLNEIEMGLNCLFSYAENNFHSREQIEILQDLAQEFENILLA